MGATISSEGIQGDRKKNVEFDFVCQLALLFSVYLGCRRGFSSIFIPKVR